MIKRFGSWFSNNTKGGYRAHLKKILIDREKAKIPETLALLPQERIREEREGLIEKLEAENRKIRQKIKEMRKKVEENKITIRNIQNTEAQNLETDAQTDTFIFNCTVSDCKGMISNGTHKCAVCETKHCRKCREVKENEHECDPDTVETVSILKKDTKPCPKCAYQIHKLGGCDQMFCPGCKSLFSWRSGQIEYGAAHNPHALEWMRRNNMNARNIEDIPCGGLVPYNAISGNAIVKDETVLRVERVYRFVGELNYAIQRTVVDNATFDRVRMEYVKGNLSEKDWVQVVFKNDRKHERENTLRDILTTCRTLCVERFRNLAMKVQEDVRQNRRQSLRTVPGVYNEFLEDIEKIRVFVNETIQKELIPLGTRKPSLISDDWIYIAK
jgi:hypothetical protein